MAQPQSHISFSVIVALAYAAGGMMFFGFPPEHILLASVIIMVAGMLPNIDDGGGNAAKEFGSILAAVSPLLLLQAFPALRQGGVARIALVVVVCYVLTRLVIVRGLKKYATHRGMIHSFPAAILTFEVTYLLFWDLPLRNRVFIALAAFAGFLSHLLLDAYGNIDIVGKATGKPAGSSPVLKFFGPTWGSTFAVYAGIAVLGWFIAKDFYPGLGIYGGVTY